MSSIYSIIKYTPDIIRNESINIGLITADPFEVYLSKVKDFKRIKVFINKKNSNNEIILIKTYLNNFLKNFKIGQNKYKEEFNCEIECSDYLRYLINQIKQNQNPYTLFYLDEPKGSLSSAGYLIENLTKEVLY